MGLSKQGLSVLGLYIHSYAKTLTVVVRYTSWKQLDKKLLFPPPHISSRSSSHHSFSRAHSCRLDDWMLRSPSSIMTVSECLPFSGGKHC